MVKSIYDQMKYFYLMIELDELLLRRLPTIKIKTNKSLYISYKSYL